jgi:hypothetical protein
MADGRAKVHVITDWPLENRTNGFAVSEKGGEDQVAHPLGTGPRLFMAELNVTVCNPSDTEVRLVPDGTPEKSSFWVEL